MCGRYATTRSAADLSALFEVVDETAAGAGPDAPRPRFNVAPTDPAPVVRGQAGAETRVLSMARWGLLPHWASDPRQGARMINARAETVTTTRAYRDAFAGRRAVVPVDGWYEWRRTAAGGRQAFYLTPRDGSVLALAGLWSRWGEDRLLTFTVITTAAVADLSDVHDRMPLILPASQWQTWLTAQRPESLLAPVSPEVAAEIEIRPVGPAVGNVRNDGPELVRRIDVPTATGQPQPTLF